MKPDAPCTHTFLQAAIALAAEVLVLKEHAETLHGIARLIIVQVAPFRRPLDIFSSTTFIVSSCRRSITWCGFPSNLPEAYFTCESVFWLPDDLADGGGTKGASHFLSRGLFGVTGLSRPTG